MSYTPQTWANGDIITATKLNNIESGVQSVSNSYTPTTWVTGDIITATKLNNIEQGIANAGGGSSDFSTAEVTFICNSPEDVEATVKMATVEEAAPPFVANATSTGGFSLFNGDEVVRTAILYKGHCGITFTNVVSASGTGDISHIDDAGAKITGDCTITIS